MYLHAGSHKNIREKDIIGIFDTDNCTVSPISRKFLSAAQKRGEIESANDEIPKSFIVSGKVVSEKIKNKEKKKNIRICFSQLSTSSLIGRIGQYTYN